MKEKKSEGKNRAKAVKSLKDKTKTRSARMVKSIDPQPSTLGGKMANKLPTANMAKSIEPQHSTSSGKMATKSPTSKNEVKKVKFRFNFIVSDNDVKVMMEIWGQHM